MCKLVITILILLLSWSCKSGSEELYTWHKLKVTATAYNSLAYQTNSNPHITAFGDSLNPGMRIVAVSRDLLKSELAYNTPVKIEGFDSVYYVKDKMHARWKNRIDIYMGHDVKAAKAWGRKTITIAYGVLKDSIE